MFKKPFATVNSKVFTLNKSKSKFVNIALANELGFQPCIQIEGVKNDCVSFSETEWAEFLKYSGIITNYFYSSQVPAIINGTTFTVSFEKFKDIKVIRIEDRRGNYVYLGEESICQLLMLLPLIEYRVEILKKQQFQSYFNAQLMGVKNNSGDICQQLLNSIFPSVTSHNDVNSENISTLMEVIYLWPELCTPASFSMNYYNVFQ